MVFVCNFHMNVWYHSGNAYTCVPTIEQSGCEYFLAEVKGTHLPGKTNSDVTGMNFWDRTINQFPKNLEIFFPNLDRFHFRNSNLFSISSEDLRPFRNLVYFAIGEKSKLMSIESDLFKYTPKLELVAFNNAPIKNVGFGLLDNLKHLKQVNFFNNDCINVRAGTTQEIEELKRKLTLQCPPLMLACPQGCSDRADSSDKEIAELKKLVHDQGSSITYLAQKIVELEKKIENFQ